MNNTGPDIKGQEFFMKSSSDSLPKENFSSAHKTHNEIIICKQYRQYLNITSGQQKLNNIWLPY